MRIVHQLCSRRHCLRQLRRVLGDGAEDERRGLTEDGGLT